MDPARSNPTVNSMLEMHGSMWAVNHFFYALHAMPILGAAAYSFGEVDDMNHL
jgi:hypothetical protein